MASSPYLPLLERLEARLAPANVDVVRYHNDLFLSGQNLQEETLTPANVNATNFGTLFSQLIDGQAYTQPLYKHDLAIPAGAHKTSRLLPRSMTAFTLSTPIAIAVPTPCRFGITATPTRSTASRRSPTRNSLAALACRIEKD
jgi:hypothetical protein